MPTWTRRAEKDVAELPDAMQDKARSLASRLDEEPALGKKLKGKLEGVRSARLGRSHRMLYRIVDDRVVVLTVSPRRDAYR
jgi:mRNA-degrading endonuclease RelE of RelBE toxin-antitoxin system